MRKPTRCVGDRASHCLAEHCSCSSPDCLHCGKCSTQRIGAVVQETLWTVVMLESVMARQQAVDNVLSMFLVRTLLS